MNWIWIAEDTVDAVHDRQIAEHGGAPGIRDEALVKSALAAPRNLAAYQDCDIFDLAAAYGHAIAKNHGFMDGNKRTAYVVTLLFLHLNGAFLSATGVERVFVFEALGGGTLSREDFAAWLRKYCRMRRE